MIENMINVRINLECENDHIQYLVHIANYVYIKNKKVNDKIDASIYISIHWGRYSSMVLENFEGEFAICT